MTRKIRVSLGSPPCNGKQSLDLTSRFKAQLRSLSKQPEQVTLLTVTHTDPPHMEVVAFYDADDPCAAGWVKQAEAVSAELWQKLGERRKGTGR